MAISCLKDAKSVYKRLKRFLKNRPIRSMNCLWRPCLLMDRDEMSNLHRGPFIDASYQVSVHLAAGFQGRRLKCEKLTLPELFIVYRLAVDIASKYTQFHGYMV
jgi:hypothetical protein